MNFIHLSEHSESGTTHCSKIETEVLCSRHKVITLLLKIPLTKFWLLYFYDNAENDLKKFQFPEYNDIQIPFAIFFCGKGCHQRSRSGKRKEQAMKNTHRNSQPLGPCLMGYRAITANADMPISTKR